MRTLVPPTPPKTWREQARERSLDPYRLVRALEYTVVQVVDEFDNPLDQYEIRGGKEPYWVQLDDLESPPCDCADATWRSEDGKNPDGTRKPGVLCAHVCAVLLFEDDKRTLYQLGQAVSRFSRDNRLTVVIAKGPIRKSPNIVVEQDSPI